MGRRGGGARVQIAWSLARLRSVRREFTLRPAFAHWHVWAALPDARDLRDVLRADGIETRTLADALRALDDAAEYARADLDARAWDAAAVEIEGAIAALERIELTTGSPSSSRPRRLPRRPLAHAFNALLSADADLVRSLAAWRRLDLALWRIAGIRRSIARDPEGSRGRASSSLEGFASPRRLRPVVRRALADAPREVKNEAARLLDEAQEAADYADAAIDLSAWGSVATDLDRLDAGLRALRHMVQRESPAYLPEPWPLRLPARFATIRALRREEATRGTVRRKEIQTRLDTAGPD